MSGVRTQDKDPKCIAEQPGGRCEGEPTGQGQDVLAGTPAKVPPFARQLYLQHRDHGLRHD